MRNAEQCERACWPGFVNGLRFESLEEGPAHSRSLRRPMGVMRTSNAVALMRTHGLSEGRTVYAILMAAAFSRPSSVTLSSRIKNFWTLPVTVMGKASTKRT